MRYNLAFIIISIVKRFRYDEMICRTQILITILCSVLLNHRNHMVNRSKHHHTPEAQQVIAETYRNIGKRCRFQAEVLYFALGAGRSLK